MSKYAIPCIISLLVSALYNIVDQIFIANADCLGFTDVYHFSKTFKKFNGISPSRFLEG